MNSPEQSASVARLSNSRIAVLALHALGGATTRRTTQEVALRCFKMAPRRFAWKNHPNYPSDKTAFDALNDAKKARYGKLVAGGGKDAWILTPAGIAWCGEHEQELGQASMGGPSQLTDPELRSLRQLRRHRLFEVWKTGGEPPPQELVADAVRLLPDAQWTAVRRKAEDLLAAARSAELNDVEGFLSWLMRARSTVS